MALRYSISLPSPVPGETASVDDLVRIAHAIEADCFDACATTDHPFPIVTSAAGHQAHDPFVLLSYLAAATERLQLHFNLIVLPYRNPFLVARMLATLDVVSGGRVIATLGSGYMRQEFAALGADFDARGTWTAAGIEAIRAAWTGEPVFYEGPGYRAEGNVMWPAPITRNGPRLWRGGNSRLAMRHAAKAFDGWSPFEATASKSQHTATDELGLATLPERLSTLRELEAREGRATRLEVCFVRNRTEWLDDHDREDQVRQLKELGVDWLVLRPRGRTPDEIVEGVAELRDVVGR
jgi:probable F420-dependent oxidoreductase